MLRRIFARHTLKCSVTSMPPEGLLDDKEEEVSSNSNNYRPNNSFNLQTTVRRCKSCCADLENLNVYMYCEKH